MRNITVLDGGMGRELQRIGAPFQQPEWSALALMQAPEKVIEAHQNFISAGADIITTNNYAVLPYHIGHDRFSEQAVHLLNVSIQCAQQAISGKSIKIAGSIPPLFGSYKPDLFRAEEAPALLKPHKEILESHINIWLLETVSSIAEILFLLENFQDTQHPVWLSLSLDHNEDNLQTPILRSGETLKDALSHIMRYDIDAVLFNCCLPEDIEPAIRLTANTLDNTIRIGAYANAFAEKKRTHDANKALSKIRDDITPESYADFAVQWVNAGASIIGGCCGIGPDHLRKVREILS